MPAEKGTFEFSENEKGHFKTQPSFDNTRTNHAHGQYVTPEGNTMYAETYQVWSINPNTYEWQNLPSRTRLMSGEITCANGAILPLETFEQAQALRRDLHRQDIVNEIYVDGIIPYSRWDFHVDKNSYTSSLKGMSIESDGSGLIYGHKDQERPLKPEAELLIDQSCEAGEIVSPDDTPGMNDPKPGRGRGNGPPMS